jgi:hypothetical protein
MYCLANKGDDDVYSKNEALCIFKERLEKSTFSALRSTSDSHGSRVAQ